MKTSLSKLLQQPERNGNGKQGKQRVRLQTSHRLHRFRLIILDLLGRTSVGASLPAQQQSDARSGRREMPPLGSPAYLRCGCGWMVGLLGAAGRIHTWGRGSPWRWFCCGCFWVSAEGNSVLHPCYVEGMLPKHCSGAADKGEEPCFPAG